jgi:hypothetical protein
MSEARISSPQLYGLRFDFRNAIGAVPVFISLTASSSLMFNWVAAFFEIPNKSLRHGCARPAAPKAVDSS